MYSNVSSHYKKIDELQIKGNYAIAKPASQLYISMQCDKITMQLMHILKEKAYFKRNIGFIRQIETNADKTLVCKALWGGRSGKSKYNSNLKENVFLKLLKKSF